LRAYVEQRRGGRPPSESPIPVSVLERRELYRPE